MAVNPVTSAIAMQLRQQRRILFCNLVRLLCRTDELVGIECHAFLRQVERDRVCLRQSRAAAMTRYAHRANRAATFR